MARTWTVRGMLLDLGIVRWTPPGSVCRHPPAGCAPYKKPYKFNTKWSKRGMNEQV